MDKRYQVFLSSTYTDLIDERQLVIQALMEIDCIPAGMELFPAVDEEQLEFIKKVIDDCDYYLLIIGGRYGSTAPDGISYTEKEYNYAVSKGLKVVALIHGEPGKISFEKSEQTSEQRERLTSFINKVKTGRLVNFWTTPAELPGLVSSNMMRTIKMHPAIGWVRADKIATEALLTEINELRKKNEEMQKVISEFSADENYSIEEIADFDSDFTIHFNDRYDNQKEIKISWKKIFSTISPFFVAYIDEYRVRHVLSNYFKNHYIMNELSSLTIDEQDFKTITIQLRAYGLIENVYTKTRDGMVLFWHLTKKGERLMMENRIVRKDTVASSEVIPLMKKIKLSK